MNLFDRRTTEEVFRVLFLSSFVHPAVFFSSSLVLLCVSNSTQPYVSKWGAETVGVNDGKIRSGSTLKWLRSGRMMS